MRGGQALELRQMLERLWSEISVRVATVEPGELVSAELALGTSGGPLRLAMDELGHRHLLVPISDQQEAVADWRSAGVQMTARVKVMGEGVLRFLDLECRRDDLNGVFTGLVADVCAVVALERRLTGSRLAAVLESWRRLLGGSPQVWTVPRLAGLYGELMILELLLDHDPAAADTWVGPAGAPQDFHRLPHAIEVKTTTAPTGRLVHVHGVDQLEAPSTGSLTLVWIRLAPLSGGMADGIPSVVERCLKKASSAVLLSALDRIGLPSLRSAELRNTGFELLERRLYDVGPDFPAITPAGFAGGAVPAGVENIEYVVDLDVVSASEESLESVITRFVKRS